MLLDINKHSPELLNVQTIQNSLDLILETVMKSPLTDDGQKKKFSFELEAMNENSFRVSWMIKTKLGLIGLVVSQPEIRNNEDIMKTLLQLMHHDWRLNHKRSLLNECISTNTIEVVAIARLAVIRFLLEAGEDPNALDSKCGNAPLHTLVCMLPARSEQRIQLVNSIAHLLLDFGAHLDRVNQYGKTAANVWIENKEKEKFKWYGDQNRTIEMPGWLQESFPKLTCLCTKVICSYKIPYLKKIPETLRYFVEMHCRPPVPNAFLYFNLPITDDGAELSK